MIITANYFMVLTLCLLITAFIVVVDHKRLQKQPPSNSMLHWRNFLVLVLIGLIIYLGRLNFPITLTFITLITGVIALVDQLFFYRRRKRSGAEPNLVTDNARAFFPVLLIVWIIRSFIIQPYHVPTGSLEPTVMPGDLIAVNQYVYGLRFPGFNFKLVNTGEPKIGDIALFYFPIDPNIIYVKRVIGTPGDHIVYRNKVLYINGKEATQQSLGLSKDIEPDQQPILVELKQENLAGVKHQILLQPEGGEDQDFDLVVPEGMYFMMGDNRDNSGDSRVWGFVPEHNLIGKAISIIASWDATNHRLRLNRFFKSLY